MVDPLGLCDLLDQRSQEGSCGRLGGFSADLSLHEQVYFMTVVVAVDGRSRLARLEACGTYTVDLTGAFTFLRCSISLGDRSTGGGFDTDVSTRLWLDLVDGPSIGSKSVRSSAFSSIALSCGVAIPLR